MEVHIPEPEEGYHFDKIKKKNSGTRWRLLFFFFLLVIIISGLILNGFSFDFSDKRDNERVRTLDEFYGF